MKLVSWNVNGIRAVLKKGFLDYMAKVDADVICLQETKAHPGDVQHVAWAAGYKPYWYSALKKGYSGTVIFTREEPKKVTCGIGLPGHDDEGLLRLHVDPTALEASAVVPVLESAIAHGRQAEIIYHVPSRDEESRRVVDPRGLARVEDLLYLDAWCHTAQGDRAFRVDRIVSATELDSPAADPGARARDLTGGWFTDSETRTVTLRLSPPARWVTEYYQVTDQRPGPDGTIDVDLEVASEQWVRSLLFRLAPHATLLAPDDYAEAFTAAARATLSLYEADRVDS